LAVERRSEAAGAVARVFDAVIGSRAVVLDEMSARHRAVQAATDPEVHTDYVDWVDASQHCANLVVHGPGALAPQEYRKVLDDARAAERRAEQRLAEKSSVFRDEMSARQVGWRQVVAALPAGSALVSYVRYTESSPELQMAPGAAAARGSHRDQYLGFV